jgi:hypothetical protein
LAHDPRSIRKPSASHPQAIRKPSASHRRAAMVNESANDPRGTIEQSIII